MVLALIVGTGAGLGAAILIYSLRLLTAVAQQVIRIGPLGQWWYLILIPLGIFAAWVTSARWAPEAAGHGVPQILEAMTLRGGNIAPRIAVVKTVATAFTIGFGGSAGREGSIAHIGASIGSYIGNLTRLGETETRALVAAGAGAGIAATFNAPIAGMFFAMEVILRDVSIRHLHTIAVASVAGAVVSHALIGQDLMFQVSPYALGDPAQLILYGLLGLISVALAIIYIRALDWFFVVPDRLIPWTRPLLLGLGIAAVAALAPEIRGTSQTFVGAVLRQEISKTWWVFALLALAKLFATAATLGGKGAGGIFMPSLFIGAMTGTAFASLMAPIWPGSQIEPGTYALVAMAAVFAGVSRASFTSILIVFEITGDYGLVLPLILAVAIATVLADRFQPESAYTSPLARKGIHAIPGDQVDLLTTVTIGDLNLRPPITVTPSDTLAEVEGVLRRNRLNGVAVVDDDGRLVGIVSDSDINRLGGASDQLTAADAMTPDPATIPTDLPVSQALERMAALGVGRLPVVDRSDPDKIEAMFRREDAIAAYHLALGSAARSDRLADRVATPTSISTRYLDYTIPPGSIADGRKIREVPWPEGCIVVSVHRGNDLLVASGDVELRAGDALTVFCDEVARQRLIERLSSHPDPG